jgi:uncharacterized protein YtpQ (UPF0354 family)
MPVRAVPALAALVLLLAGCAGEDTEPEARPATTAATLLSELSFTQAAAAAIRGADVEAEPEEPLRIVATQGLNRVTLELDEAYAEYEARPASKDEILAGVGAEAQSKLETALETDSFTAVKSHLRPLLKPPFALRRLPEEPIKTPFPGRLHVVYAVDRESDFTLVTPEHLARWGKRVAEIDRIAKRNLSATTEALLCEEELCGWANGDGYDATRMIVPELRADIVAEIGPAVYAVPQENVFVALPLALADRIRTRVLEQFTTSDRPVSPEVFVERGGELVVLE